MDNSSKETPILPIWLRMARHDAPDMQTALAGRVDLRKLPTEGQLRCGVDPVGAHRVARLDPRSNSGRVKKGKQADSEAREIWISHPTLPNTWLHVWVSPAVFEIARELEIFLKLAPSRRDEQVIVGTLQRVSDLRMLGVVILSVWTENHRRPNGSEVAEYELLSDISTTPPPESEAVLEFSDELARLFATDEAQRAVLTEIDRAARERRRKVEARLAKARDAILPATANGNRKGAAE